jgi:nitrite reductase (NADH) small subunit
MTDWKRIGPIESIPLRGARRLCLQDAGRPVALFRTGENEVFALVDECPHKKGPLSEGIVSGKTVTCPLHNWVIALDDGKAAPPDDGEVRALPLKVIDGEVYIHIERTAGAAA